MDTRNGGDGLKVLKWAGNVLTVLIVALTVLLVGAQLIGIRTYVVTSGSMEPTYHVGSLIYVQKESPDKINEGDVITFALPNDIAATHRVVEVNREEKWFKTKGDANEYEDSGHVTYENVYGVPKFTVPYVGYVANFIQHPPGIYIAIGVCVCILVFAFVPDMLNKREEKKDE